MGIIGLLQGEFYLSAVILVRVNGLMGGASCLVFHLSHIVIHAPTDKVTVLPAPRPPAPMVGNITSKAV